jgi:ferritin-like metal-binding protein YciE
MRETERHQQPARQRKRPLSPLSMSLFNLSQVEAASLHDLLLHELNDLYDAEKQLVEALPKMAEAASSSELAHAFRTHLEETKDHVTRLEDCFHLLNTEAKHHTCDGMKGLLMEGEHVIKGKMKGSVKDSALIAAAQRVEHYEIAGYGTARTFAEMMEHTQVAELLQKTLDEEGAADKLLTKIAKTTNEKANVHTKEMKEVAGVA